MIVPKEIAEKAERFENLTNELDRLRDELETWAYENGYVEITAMAYGTTWNPEGEPMEGGEYLNHTPNILFGEDHGSGKHYYPIEDSDMFMWIEYQL